MRVTTRIPHRYIYIYILSEAIFSAHRFCEGPPFQKAKHFSTSDGNSKKVSPSLRIYIYIYVCALSLARAPREPPHIEKRRTFTPFAPFAMLFYIHPSASTSSQEVAILLFTATYEFDLCFGTNAQSAWFAQEHLADLNPIFDFIRCQQGFHLISTEITLRTWCIFCTLGFSKRPTGTYLCCCSSTAAKNVLLLFDADGIGTPMF